jgi:hypothetical protein
MPGYGQFLSLRILLENIFKRDGTHTDKWRRKRLPLKFN